MACQSLSALKGKEKAKRQSELTPAPHNIPTLFYFLLLQYYLIFSLCAEETLAHTLPVPLIRQETPGGVFAAAYRELLAAAAHVCVNASPLLRSGKGSSLFGVQKF